MNKSIVLMAALVLAGCDFGSTRVDSDARQIMPVRVSDRIQVVKIQEFRDRLAYDNVRGIYIITDKKTGNEYIGVSGIGISETGRHGCGKTCSREDER